MNHSFVLSSPQMKLALGPGSLFFILTVSTTLVGCSNTPVGNPCTLGIPGDSGDNDNNSIVSSPVVDCESRICIRTPQQGEPPEGFTGSQDYCTADCGSDSDCSESGASSCITGFSCRVATTTTRFCCRKLCVCNDYLDSSSTQPDVPEECDPDNPINTCQNLPGRS